MEVIKKNSPLVKEKKRDIEVSLNIKDTVRKQGEKKQDQEIRKVVGQVLRWQCRSSKRGSQDC